MTAKFRQIIEQLNALTTFKVDKLMSDVDFIANIDAINLLCNLYDDLGLDSSEIRRKINCLYRDFSRRIYSKRDIQLAMPLIKALYRFIYGRDEYRGPKRWRDSLAEMCCKVVDSFRKEAFIDSADYLFALDIACSVNEGLDQSYLNEYKEELSALLKDIDNITIDERIRRVSAYERVKSLFAPDNWEKWAEVRESLKEADLSQLNDETFILWREITDMSPLKELKKRAGHSKQMQVEYMQGLIYTEFAKLERLADNRKLSRSLKTLNDELIGDIIPLKIDASMSVSTLYALETIFYLRLQLAQVSWAENEPIYELLCRNRFEQIAKALTNKYQTAEILNEKIKILERLSSIGMTIHSSDLNFAIDEADKLKELSNLTYTQKLRLEWIPTINSENESQIVDRILSAYSLAKRDGERLTSFEMETLAFITDFVSDKEREDIFNRYFDMLDTAITTDNAAEIGRLLSLAAYWNSSPSIRIRLSRATEKVASIESQSLPEKRVNMIAAEIYKQINKITGKYDIFDVIPA